MRFNHVVAILCFGVACTPLPGIPPAQKPVAAGNVPIVIFNWTTQPIANVTIKHAGDKGVGRNIVSQPIAPGGMAKVASLRAGDYWVCASPNVYSECERAFGWDSIHFHQITLKLTRPTAIEVHGQAKPEHDRPPADFDVVDAPSEVQLALDRGAQLPQAQQPEEQQQSQATAAGPGCSPTGARVDVTTQCCSSMGRWHDEKIDGQEQTWWTCCNNGEDGCQ